jgi:hypothetical protein
MTVRPVHIKWTTALAVSLGLAVLGAGCGGPGLPGSAGSATGNAGIRYGGHAMAKAVAYARCMRGHGVPDFPDPTASPGGGFGFQINGGPGTDLNAGNPKFRAAGNTCRSLLPGGGGHQPISVAKLVAEVKWAHCMRSHGVPGFPDPDAQGAFDSSRFDDSSPAFQAASQECQSVEPSGPVAAVPGNGSAP